MEIDPRYLDSPYYIAPGERVAEEAFSIIRDAMRDEKVVGLGRVVMARRERVILLEPLGKGLLGTVLRYASEVRSEESYFEDIPDLKLPEEMKDLAHVIIEKKSGHFNAAEFNDRYEDAVVELIRSKQAGLPARATEQPRPSNVVNIMDALRKSIAAVGAAEPAAKTSQAGARGGGSGGAEAESAFEDERRGRGCWGRRSPPPRPRRGRVRPSEPGEPISRKIDDLDVERKLRLVRAGAPRGVDLRRPAGLAQPIVGNQMPCADERREHVGDSVRGERRGTVHDVEVQVRHVGIAGVPRARDHLASLQPLAGLDG